MSEFKRGDQIKYTDGVGSVERGFVTDVRETAVFCRFWSVQYPGSLRTLANSEGCNPEDLTKEDFVLQGIVDEWLDHLGYNL